MRKQLEGFLFFVAHHARVLERETKDLLPSEQEAKEKQFEILLNDVIDGLIEVMESQKSDLTSNEFYTWELSPGKKWIDFRVYVSKDIDHVKKMTSRPQRIKILEGNWKVMGNDGKSPELCIVTESEFKANVVYID